MILNDVAMRVRPLVKIDDFVKLCTERNLDISQERLHRLEQLRVFMPIITIRRPPNDDRTVRLIGEPVDELFDIGWIVDTSARDEEYLQPAIDDRDSMPFYSVFQVWELEEVLQAMEYTTALEFYLGADARPVDWDARLNNAIDWASGRLERLRSDRLRRSAPVLAQVISNRYLPLALGNERTISLSTTTQLGEWFEFYSGDWEWWEFCAEWNPTDLIEPFSLDQESLRKAHRAVATTMRGCDPMRAWANLLPFVSQQKRDELRGDALRAELYRQLAAMLRSLYSDLYGEDLGPPHEVFGTVVSHIPELEAREDPRRHLEFVVNQYDLNPQPKAVLFVEGESEVVFVKKIFRDYFWTHHGASAIEIVNLGGVGNATGNKREDRFSAIFRLVDYLHHHQTIAFLMLDNEGGAGYLKEVARDKASLFGQRRLAILPDQIVIWDKSFELDNFSDEEIARALTEVADGRWVFEAVEVADVRAQREDESLSSLFKGRTDHDIRKTDLAECLAESVIESAKSRDADERPVVKFLARVHEDAARNHWPVTQEISDHNQATLG